MAVSLKMSHAKRTRATLLSGMCSQAGKWYVVCTSSYSDRVDDFSVVDSKRSSMFFYLCKSIKTELLVVVVVPGFYLIPRVQNTSIMSTV
jgi:hypothetical protein